MNNLLLHFEITLKQSKFLFWWAIHSSKFLNKHFFLTILNSALQTGVPEKLYAAFQGVIGSEYNVTELMDAWVYKPGYPLITAAVANDRKRVVITQKRYLQNNPNQEDKTLWHVPITYATDKVNNDFADTKPTKILSNESFEIEFKEPIDWIILNVQQTGKHFHRTILIWK